MWGMRTSASAPAMRSLRTSAFAPVVRSLRTCASAPAVCPARTGALAAVGRSLRTGITGRVVRLAGTAGFVPAGCIPHNSASASGERFMSLGDSARSPRVSRTGVSAEGASAEYRRTRRGGVFVHRRSRRTLGRPHFVRFGSVSDARSGIRGRAPSGRLGTAGDRRTVCRYPLTAVPGSLLTGRPLPPKVFRATREQQADRRSQAPVKVISGEFVMHRACPPVARHCILNGIDALSPDGRDRSTTRSVDV